MCAFRRGAGLRWLVLLVALVALSGCVWMRLLSLKNQLADFDTHVEVLPDGPGLALRLRHPVVAPGDIAWLFGGGPSQSSDGRHLLRFHRPSQPQQAPVDLALVASDDRVTEVMLPHQLFHLLPRERLIALMRAFGSAAVDRGAREASTALAAADAAQVPAGRDEVIAAFGPPDAEVPIATGMWMHYTFSLQVPEGASPVARIEVLIEGGHVQRLRVVAAQFSVWLRLAQAPVAAPGGR